MSHGGSAVHRSGPTRRASGPIRSVSRTVVVFNNGGHKTKTSRSGCRIGQSEASVLSSLRRYLRHCLRKVTILGRRTRSLRWWGGLNCVNCVAYAVSPVSKYKPPLTLTITTNANGVDSARLCCDFPRKKAADTGSRLTHFICLAFRSIIYEANGEELYNVTRGVTASWLSVQYPASAVSACFSAHAR